MQPDLFDAQYLGNFAGMLSGGAAECTQNEVADVLATFDRNFTDRVGHTFDGDGQETVGNRFRRYRGNMVGRDRFNQFVKLAANHIDIQLLIGVRSKYAGEITGRYAAQQQVGIRNRQRAIAAVTSRSRIGPGRIGTDLKTLVLVFENRSPTCSNRMDFHHRRTQSYPCYY